MIIVNTIFHIIYQFTLSCSTFNPQAGISGIFRRVNTYWVLCPRGIVTVSFASSRLTICTSYCLIIIISYLNKNALSQSLFVWRFGGWQTFILLLMPIGLEQTFLRPHWILSQLTSQTSGGLSSWSPPLGGEILHTYSWLLYPCCCAKGKFPTGGMTQCSSVYTEHWLWMCSPWRGRGICIYIYVCVCVCVCVW